jgi:signal transduction histidine kinase
LAISTAAVAACAMRHELRVDSTVLWVLGLAALVNMGAPLLSDSPWAPVARTVSPVLGMTSWALLSFLTGGTTSPLVAGFWLEIVFSAIVLAPAGTLLVAGGAAVALWGVHAALGAEPGSVAPWPQTIFIGAIGTLTFYASRRWRSEHRALSVEAGTLCKRLRDLEEELEATRTLGRVGEGVARLAHGLKNTAHSLRGFANLIEASRAGDDAQREALEGLKRSIDALESTARSTLRPPAPQTEPSRTTTSSELRRTVDDVIAEMTKIHAGVRWVRAASDQLPDITLPSAVLREVLLILAQNAVEASGASGEIVLRADADEGSLRLVVQDQGPGMDPALGDFCRPGATTKPAGSGYGLFLARRLVESGGGRLNVARAAQGGALVSIRLPVSPT